MLEPEGTPSPFMGLVHRSIQPKQSTNHDSCCTCLRFELLAWLQRVITRKGLTAGVAVSRDDARPTSLMGVWELVSFNGQRLVLNAQATEE